MPTFTVSVLLAELMLDAGLVTVKVNAAEVEVSPVDVPAE